MLLSYTIVDFYLHVFYNGDVDMQICALLTKSQCKVSDNQVTPVTVKTCRSLLSSPDLARTSFSRVIRRLAVRPSVNV